MIFANARLEEQDAAVYIHFLDAPRDQVGSLWPQVSNNALCIRSVSYNIDIDHGNIQTATKTVSTNGLESRIQIIKTDPNSELIPFKQSGVERFVQHGPDSPNLIADMDSLDFTMCNPPFYASRDELIASAEAKERPPFSVNLTCYT